MNTDINTGQELVMMSRRLSLVKKSQRQEQDDQKTLVKSVKSAMTVNNYRTTQGE